MTAKTLTLADFLLARIAEDEAAARVAGEDSFNGLDGPIATGDDPWPTERRFAERFTPARVLAECEAKRRIVDVHGSDDPEWEGDCPECGYKGPCRTLRALALPYADRPDFRPEWSA